MKLHFDMSSPLTSSISIHKAQGGVKPLTESTVTIRVRCVRADESWIAIRGIDGSDFTSAWYRPKVFHAMDFTPKPGMEFDCIFSVRNGESDNPVGVMNISMSDVPTIALNALEEETERVMRKIGAD